MLFMFKTNVIGYAFYEFGAKDVDKS